MRITHIEIAWIEHFQGKWDAYEIIHRVCKDPPPPDITEIGFILTAGPEERELEYYTDGKQCWEVENQTICLRYFNVFATGLTQIKSNQYMLEPVDRAAITRAIKNYTRNL